MRQLLSPSFIHLRSLHSATWLATGRRHQGITKANLEPRAQADEVKIDMRQLLSPPFIHLRSLHSATWIKRQNL